MWEKNKNQTAASLGYQFWTDIFTIPTDTSVDFTIPHQDVTVTVTSDYDGDVIPLEGLNVYLFTAAESYLSQNQLTDNQGQVKENKATRKTAQKTRATRETVQESKAGTQNGAEDKAGMQNGAKNRGDTQNGARKQGGHAKRCQKQSGHAKRYQKQSRHAKRCQSR